MTLLEILQAVEGGLIGTLEGIDPSTALEEDDHLIVDDLVAIRVAIVSQKANYAADIEILDGSGEAIGTLCFTKLRGLTERHTLTKWQYVAFLNDAGLTEVHASEYAFKSDYVVVERRKLAAYKNDLMHSAPLWGGFCHEDSPALGAGTIEGPLTAVAGIVLPTTHHKEALRRYVSASNAFDRFLKLYHCLELLFDYVIYMRIKALGDELIGFSAIISEHGRTELDRLKAIMKQYCGRPDLLADEFRNSTPFKDLRKAIFRVHGKSGDPAIDDGKWNRLVDAIDGGECSADQWCSRKIIKQVDQFDDLVIDLSAYWIYRVRSSIAHNRVGEYLLEDQNENFVAQFAEPMLLNVVKQVFASDKLRQIKSNAVEASRNDLPYPIP